MATLSSKTGLPSFTPGGGGSGGVNLILSPSQATGWTATNTSGSVFIQPVTTGAPADLPLEGATNSAIQFSATGSGPENINYNSYPIVTSAAMNGKLQVDFFMRPGTGFVSNEWTVSVYQGAVRQTLGTDSGGFTFLPNATTRFTTSFDAIANTAYTLRFARVSGSGSATLNVCNVFLGWPFVSQTVAVSSDQILTTITTQGFAAGSTVTGNLAWRRSVSRMEIQGYWTNGTVQASTAHMTLPGGYTIDANVIPSGATQVVGSWTHSSATGSFPKRGVILATGGLTYVRFGIDDYTNTTNPIAPLNASSFTQNALAFEINLSIPIAEWAGAVSTAPVPAEEFASTTEAWTSTGSTTSYSRLGQAMAGALAGAVDKTITWQYPPQTDDNFEVEFSKDQVQWFVAARAQIGPSNLCVVPGTNAAGTYVAGIDMRPGASANQTIITFRQYMQIANDDSPVVDWPSSAAYWRVRKTKKASLPFANAGLDGSSGHYKAGQAPGLTTGVAIGAGYVGEVVETASAITSTTATTSEADVNNASISLTAGVWQIFYSVTAYYLTGAASGNEGYTQVAVTDSSNVKVGKTERIILAKTTAAVTNNIYTSLAASCVVRPSSISTYKLRTVRSDISGTGSGGVLVVNGTYNATFYAVRIA